MRDAPKPREAYRVTAFDNPDVNGPWLCNKGFDQHKWMSRERAAPRIGSAHAGTDAAIEHARGLWAAARNPAVLVSSHASNEALAAVAALLGPGAAAYVHADCTPSAGEVVEDDLLIRADKNPNRYGAQMRFGAREFDAAVGHDLVVAWGEVGEGTVPAGVPWIHLTPFGTPHSHPAAVVIPISTAFERSGTFDNFAGRRSAFAAVFEKPEGVEHAEDVFRRLLS